MAPRIFLPLGGETPTSPTRANRKALLKVLWSSFLTTYTHAHSHTYTHTHTHTHTDIYRHEIYRFAHTKTTRTNRHKLLHTDRDTYTRSYAHTHAHTHAYARTSPLLTHTQCLV